MKAHIRKAHSSTLLAHEAKIQVSMLSWRPVMISPCRICEAVVEDCRQHAGSCVPLFQLLLMSCVVTGHCRGRPQAGTNAFRASPSVIQCQRSANQQGRESGGQQKRQRTRTDEEAPDQQMLETQDKRKHKGKGRGQAKGKRGNGDSATSSDREVLKLMASLRRKWIGVTNSGGRGTPSANLVLSKMLPRSSAKGWGVR